MSSGSDVPAWIPIALVPVTVLAAAALFMRVRRDRREEQVDGDAPHDSGESEEGGAAQA